MGVLKNLVGETALYGVSSIVGRFLNYLLFPLHTMVLATNSYGIVTELYAYVAFLNIIYIYGLETSFFRYATNNPEKSRVFNTATSSILISGIVISLIISLFATEIVNAIEYPGKEHFVYMFTSILLIDAFLAIPFAKLRLEGKAKLFALAKLVSIGVNIGINVFFLYFCEGVMNGKFFDGSLEWVTQIYNPDLKVEYIFAANLVGNAVILLILFKTIVKLRLQISLDYLTKMLKYGLPVMITALALVTNEMLSRAALKYWLPEGFYQGFTSLDIVGIFGGVFKLAIIMNLGIQAFRYAAEPLFFQQSSNKESPQLFSKIMDWFVIFGCILMIGISINLNWLQYLLRNEDYRIAIHIVPVLLLANLFMGINYNLSAWYKLIDFTKAGAIITLSGAVVTIFTNWYLIPLYGYEGAAVASVLAYFSMTAINYIWSRYRNPIPYKLIKMITYIGVSWILLTLLSGLNLETLFQTVVLRNFILLIFVVILLFVERKLFKSF